LILTYTFILVEYQHAFVNVYAIAVQNIHDNITLNCWRNTRNIFQKYNRQKMSYSLCSLCWEYYL